MCLKIIAKYIASMKYLSHPRRDIELGDKLARDTFLGILKF